jgi:type II secretory pathway component GspD/PulD (secretin)
VNLKIDQEISNLGPVFQNTPSFTTRTIKTEVVLKDNQVLVMGGLIRTRDSETVEGIPWLMDIPYIGRLFSTHTNTTEQTELMLFIIPHIISNTDDSKFITEQFKRKLGSLKNDIFKRPQG